MNCGEKKHIFIQSFIQHSLRQDSWILSRTILTFACIDITSLPLHQTSVTLHQLTNNLLPSNCLPWKLAAFKHCIMSNQLAQNAKGSGRKRKFDSPSTSPASSKQTTSSDETIATSPHRSEPEDDAMVELDFQSGSVSFHAKRHKLSIPPSTKDTMIIKPSMTDSPSHEAHLRCHKDDLSTDTCIARVQCQTPLTSPSSYTVSPSKAPNASLPATLTPASSMLMPADDQLTRSESQVGVALPGLLKQSLISSSQDIPSPSSHQNVVCHPSLHSPSNITCQSSTDKKLFCSDEENAKEDVSGLRFIDDYYSVMDEYHSGTDHVRDMPKESWGEEMESVHLQALRTSKTVPSHIEQSDVMTESRVVQSNQEESCKDFSKPCKQVEAKDVEPDKSHDSTVTVSEAKTSAKRTRSRDHSPVRETLKRSSALGKMVPRSVALHAQGGNMGPSQMRRAKARESSRKAPTCRQSLLKVGKSSRSCPMSDEDDISSKLIGQTSKSERDELMESEGSDSVVGDAEREDVLGTECSSSKELAVRTELALLEEDEMEVDNECPVGKEHHEHDSMDCLAYKGDEIVEAEGRKEETGGEGSSGGPFPGLPESFSGLQESGLAAIDLFPTDEEFGVETIRRRRALLGADKGGRDSLLKEATRKLSLKAKKRKRRTSDKSGGDGSVIGGGLDEGDDKKQKRVAPNYFVAIQVCSPEIHQALQNVQQTVMAGDEKLKDAMVPIPTLHLTIMVMHLANDEDVERAKLALMECHRLLGPEITRKKLNVWFHGLGHFNNQVMFAKIKDIDGILDTLYNVAETVENCYRRHGIQSTGERGFKPHLTVMKLSRAPSLRKKGVRRIKSELYRQHSATVFGNQPVSGFQLCSINKPKSEDGYYYKAHEVLFNEDVSPIPDPFDLTGMDDGPKGPITEHVSSSVIEEEPKEPMTEGVSSPVEPSDSRAANQTSESLEAKEASQTPDTEPQTSPTANTEGDKPSTSAPT
ncbi:uncharacterized protein LOC754150 isoform X1 [Strongylocentrotus purpuratus]|uniref:A-kinase anchor protein 7-like phosphoesterase domain-containing protein n=1 Tax=Strongylocentrotus purpuratus TaxID=7668 RepID=A0A7M7NM84_STRPU|nr:uncharacterized protein LOC754150 isoform X1 [Strongylocentrotus purpuratus]